MLEYVDLNCHKSNIFSIYLTPDEILEEDFDEQVSVAIITKKLQRSIVRAIAIKMGESFRGLLNEQEYACTASAYSQERFSDIVAENKDICSQIETIIRSFVDLDFELDAKDVLVHLKKVPSYTSIKIQKKIMQRTIRKMH